jgi:putative membrane protein
MSIRHYQPHRRASDGATPAQNFTLVASTIFAIALQISYPLVHGDTLRIVTILTVCSAAFVAIIHSFLTYGFSFASQFFLITYLYAYVVELIGVKSGWPFGTYSYDPSLGIRLYGVPFLVPLAWVMITYPIFIAVRRTAKHWGFLYGGIGMMAWDFFLDPQMVSAGRWHWQIVGPHVPFQPEIPLSNSAGWLFSGMGLIALLNLWYSLVERKKKSTLPIPALFLSWALFAGFVGNLFFFHRPGVAFFSGGIFLLFLTPYFFQLRFGQPEVL